MSAVAQKLGIKAGMRVVVDGEAPEHVRPFLGELPDAVSVCARTGEAADQILLIADGLAEVARMLDNVWSEVAPGGRLWVWYRKGANKSRAQGSEVPLHRDTLQALLAQHGMDGVTLISVDDTWSSMRVRAI
jgi:peroxiredoxin